MELDEPCMVPWSILLIEPLAPFSLKMLDRQEHHLVQVLLHIFISIQDTIIIICYHNSVVVSISSYVLVLFNIEDQLKALIGSWVKSRQTVEILLSNYPQNIQSMIDPPTVRRTDMLDLAD